MKMEIKDIATVVVGMVIWTLLDRLVLGKLLDKVTETFEQSV